MKEIRQFYQLDSLFIVEEPTAVMEFDMDWLKPALQYLRSRLEALKAGWVQYISGEPESTQRFRELVTSFKTRAKDFGNHHLVKLLDAISLVSSRLPDPYPRTSQLMVIEMASAFLLVENVIENFTSAPTDLDQQIIIMGGWLLDAAKGKSSGEPPAGLRPDLSQQIGSLQLRAQVSKEILANLQHLEQTLDAFARDPAKRDTLLALKPYLRQIHGALFVLRFERAAEVLRLCEDLIAACARPDHDYGMSWIRSSPSVIAEVSTPRPGPTSRTTSSSHVIGSVKTFIGHPPECGNPVGCKTKLSLSTEGCKKQLTWLAWRNESCRFRRHGMFDSPDAGRHRGPVVAADPARRGQRQEVASANALQRSSFARAGSDLRAQQLLAIEPAEGGDLVHRQASRAAGRDGLEPAAQAGIGKRRRPGCEDRRVAVAATDPAKVALLQEMERHYPVDLSAPHGVAAVLRTGQPLLVADVPHEGIDRAARDARHRSPRGRSRRGSPSVAAAGT